MFLSSPPAEETDRLLTPTASSSSSSLPETLTPSASYAEPKPNTRTRFGFGGRQPAISLHSTSRPSSRRPLTGFTARLLRGDTDKDDEEKVYHSSAHSFRRRRSGRRWFGISSMRPILRGLARWLSRYKSFLFFLCLVIVFFQAGLWAGHSHPELHSYPSLLHPDNPEILRFEDNAHAGTIANLKEHPIPKLMEDAEGAFKKKLSGQSKTLKDAVKEYKRRYKRNPPKGFDEWWKFAKQNDVKMVDEYDGLIRDLEPFWSLSGEELRRRALQVGQLPSMDIVRLKDGNATTIHLDGDFKDSEVSARAHGFRRMLSQFVDKLPDMDFPINAKAEGRILVPWEHQKFPNMTLQDSSMGFETMVGGPFKPDWGGSGNVWEAWRRTCPPESPARRLLSSQRNIFASQSSNNHLVFQAQFSISPASSKDFSFVSTTPAKTADYCEQPHAHYSQGHFFSDWRTIPALYPVFSPARAQGFLDIKIPSHYYYGSTKRYTYGWDAVNLELKEVDDMEVPWEEKSDQIFWRGASTGGGNHPPGFSPQYQRHRFLRMSSDKSVSTNRTIIFPNIPSTTLSDDDDLAASPHLLAASVPIGPLNEEIMDVAFVKALSPDTYPGGLAAMQADHRFGDSVPLGKHWSFKYLVDLDGMGYSGRFMAFLASDSVPVKSTIYEEFFSDWIQPWVHFIPLSTSYREIYNIHAYFSGPLRAALVAINSTLAELPLDKRRSVEGDRRLRRIARAGKQWKKTIGRTIDMEVYVYRLCLEWARLWADDRDSMDFVPRRGSS